MSASRWPTVVYHPSQHPEALRAQLKTALERREIPAKFHYLTNQQARRWLELHDAYSPSRRDDEATSMYQRGFDAVAGDWAASKIQLIGVGCGGGQKDASLAASLVRSGATLSYVACDASPALVLGAASVMQSSHPAVPVERLVADLMEAPDLDDFWGADQRVFSCLGIVPNVVPGRLVATLVSWMRPGDRLVLSANLFVPEKVSHDLASILSQYDNELTRTWLSTLLDDVGLESSSAAMKFSPEVSSAHGQPARLVAELPFRDDAEIRFDGRLVRFRRGEKLSLFYSNRFTVDGFEGLLDDYRLKVLDRHVLDSGEEGVWVCTLD